MDRRCLMLVMIFEVIPVSSLSLNSVDGNWSKWSEWSICSVSCGNGTETRNRGCSTPLLNNEKECLTENGTKSSYEVVIRHCKLNDCPSKCEFASNVRLKASTSDSITIAWNNMFNPPTGNRTYRIFLDPGSGKNGTIVHNKEDFTASSLHPYRIYNFTVTCVPQGYLPDSRQFWTDVGIPPPLPKLQKGSFISEQEISIYLQKGSNENGPVKFYYVMVKEKCHSDKRTPLECYMEQLKRSQLSTYENFRNGEKIYIAAILYPKYITSYNILFHVGADTISSQVDFEEVNNHIQPFFGDTLHDMSFVNGPLPPDKTFQVAEIAHVDKDKYAVTAEWVESKTKPHHPTPIQILIIVVIVVVLVAAVVVLYVTKIHGKERVSMILGRKGGRRSYHGEYNPALEIDEIVHVPSAGPTNASDFPAYVKNLKKDGNYLFSEEFKLIQKAAQSGSYKSEHSNHPINRDKNRYSNIVAYDHTRVRLCPAEGIPESDYINANYIDGYVQQAAYIATQGPLEATCDHFWRMCWEQNVSTIVMLTGMEENGTIKCFQYWPEHGSTTYGMITITSSETNVFPNYEIRMFSLLHEEYPNEERFVRQFYFVSWRDHGTPYAHELLAFIRRVNHGTVPSVAPIVVHCSAGVGRTGTYICLDVNMKRIQMEDNIQIYNYLLHIRSQRIFMVRTEQQYTFIHNALLEYLTAGETEIQVTDVREYVKHLRSTDTDSGELNVDNEFQKLNMLEPSTEKTMRAANAPCNKSKNRFLNVLAYDDTRVLLRMLSNIQGSDYINANYIHGYSRIKQFIATQAPLPHTIPSFWRMVWEHNSTTIVCLSQETEGGKVKIHRYWPSIETVMHGPLMIEKDATEKRFGDFIVREMKVTHTTEGHSRTIKHFQYVGWPDNSYPESGAGMVELIGHVQKWHQQNNFGSIIVHCSAGVGRTGVFIGLCNMIERVRVEGVINVFQTVRELRNQRPAMVQTKKEYLFCYLAFQDFLASFDIYQNFF